MAEPSAIIPVDIYEHYPEFTECLDYLVLRRKTPKGKRIPMAEVAILLANKYPGMGASPAFLYRRVGEWRSNGTLAEAEKFLLNEQIEEIRVVMDEIASEIPDLLRGIMKDAKEAKRPNDRLAAMRYLDDLLAAKFARKETGSEEKVYVQRTQNFNPTDIA